MVQSNKIDAVKGIADKLKGAPSVVLTDFRGITVADITLLRTELRKDGIEMKVVKNRLLKLALADAGCESLDECLTGNTAVAFGAADPAAPAKILLEYAKKNEKLIVKGGLLEGKRLNKAGVESLSKMPSRKELLARMAGDFKQPATKLARVVNASLLKVAYGMNALAKKLEEGQKAA